MKPFNLLQIGRVFKVITAVTVQYHIQWKTPAHILINISEIFGHIGILFKKIHGIGLHLNPRHPHDTQQGHHTYQGKRYFLMMEIYPDNTRQDFIEKGLLTETPFRFFLWERQNRHHGRQEGEDNDKHAQYAKTGKDSELANGMDLVYEQGPQTDGGGDNSQSRGESQLKKAFQGGLFGRITSLQRSQIFRKDIHAVRSPHCNQENGDNHCQHGKGGPGPGHQAESPHKGDDDRTRRNQHSPQVPQKDVENNGNQGKRDGRQCYEIQPCKICQGLRDDGHSDLV